MTTYSFKPSDASQFVNWDDPTVWAGGMVPDSSDADVDFPTVTYVSSGQIYNSFVSIQENESFSVHSIELRDYLLLSGSLNVADNMTLYQQGEIDLSGGELSVGTLTNNAYDIQGSGQIAAGSLTNNTMIINTGDLVINTGTFSNTGNLTATGGGSLSLNVSGNFLNLSSGTLTGGSYVSNAGSTLAINGSGTISTDAASITLNGGAITSHDPVSGHDVPLTGSLTSVASTGILTVQSGSYMFGPLTIHGTLSLVDTSTYGNNNGTNPDHFGSSDLTVAADGTLQGGGTIDTAVANDGLILATQQNAGELVLNGDVTGSGHLEISPGSSMELGGSTAQGVVFDDNRGTLQINHPTNFTGAITPHGQGDQIVLAGISANSITGTSYVGDTNGGTLILQQADSATVSLKFVGSFTQSSFILSAGPQLLSSDPPSLSIHVGQVVCFASGTLIRTPRGDVAVEDLRARDVITTSSGDMRVIQWIGHRRFDDLLDPGHEGFWPVRIAAGAFREGVPSQDLYLSRGHAVCVDVLGEGFIPIGKLTNGSTIREVPVNDIIYWHVELDTHDVLLANGLPAESYLDERNREWFGASAGAGNLEPVTRVGDGWSRPFFTARPIVEVVRSRLNARAVELGWTPTSDMAPHLVVDGARLDGDANGDLIRFIFPAGSRDVRLVSETFVRAHEEFDADPRRLGVCITSITMTDGLQGRSDLALDDPRLTGLYSLEKEGDINWRWTKGSVGFPAELWQTFQSHVTLHIAVLQNGGRRWTKKMTRKTPLFGEDTCINVVKIRA